MINIAKMIIRAISFTMFYYNFSNRERQSSSELLKLYNNFYNNVSPCTL